MISLKVNLDMIMCIIGYFGLACCYYKDAMNMFRNVSDTAQRRGAAVGLVLMWPLAFAVICAVVCTSGMFWVVAKIKEYAVKAFQWLIKIK